MNHDLGGARIARTDIHGAEDTRKGREGTSEPAPPTACEMVDTPLETAVDIPRGSKQDAEGSGHARGAAERPAPVQAHSTYCSESSETDAYDLANERDRAAPTLENLGTEIENVACPMIQNSSSTGTSTSIDASVRATAAATYSSGARGNNACSQTSLEAADVRASSPSTTSTQPPAVFANGEVSEYGLSGTESGAQGTSHPSTGNEEIMVSPKIISSDRSRSSRSSSPSSRLFLKNPSSVTPSLTSHTSALGQETEIRCIRSGAGDDAVVAPDVPANTESLTAFQASSGDSGETCRSSTGTRFGDGSSDEAREVSDDKSSWQRAQLVTTAEEEQDAGHSEQSHPCATAIDVSDTDGKNDYNEQEREEPEQLAMAKSAATSAPTSPTDLPENAETGALRESAPHGSRTTGSASPSFHEYVAENHRNPYQQQTGARLNHPADTQAAAVNNDGHVYFPPNVGPLPMPLHHGQYPPSSGYSLSDAGQALFIPDPGWVLPQYDCGPVHAGAGTGAGGVGGDLHYTNHYPPGQQWDAYGQGHPYQQHPPYSHEMATHPVNLQIGGVSHPHEMHFNLSEYATEAAMRQHVFEAHDAEAKRVRASAAFGVAAPPNYTADADTGVHHPPESATVGEHGDRTHNAYNDIGLVVTRTKELEKVLRDLFGATGNGLNELLSSLQVSDQRIDRRTQQRIRSIAGMRNKLVHSVDANNLRVSNTFGDSARRAFKVMVDDLEATLRKCATIVPDEPLEQAARPAEAYPLGNHPAFRGIGGVRQGEGEYDEETGRVEAEAAAFARRQEEEALVVKVNARFPHNLITARKPSRLNRASSAPAPDVKDEVSFPDLSFASTAAGKQRQKGLKGASASKKPDDSGGMGSDNMIYSGSRPAGSFVAPRGQEHGGRKASTAWDGEGRIEEAQIVSGRGVCRKLGQGEMGYISTTHTMAGVYRTWGNRKWNSVEESWDTFPKAIKGGDGEGEETIIPGAAAPNGQVAFEGRGLDMNIRNAALRRASDRRKADVGREAGQEASSTGGLEGEWTAATNARRKRGQKEEKRSHSYVLRKPPAAPFWLSPGVHFGRSNCRGWFPTRQDWFARGIPQCVYVPLEPSTEDRMEAMRSSRAPVEGLSLEEEEERLMRIAMRESSAESKRAYDKKYGTEAEREARREAQAQARLKAMAERESLQRDEEKQLMEVIKASLVEALTVGEKDDREVIAAVEASNRPRTEEETDPDIQKAVAESRRQHEIRQEMLRCQLGKPPTPPRPQDTVLTVEKNLVPSPGNHRPDLTAGSRAETPVSLLPLASTPSLLQRLATQGADVRMAEQVVEGSHAPASVRQLPYGVDRSVPPAMATSAQAQAQVQHTLQEEPRALIVLPAQALGAAVSGDLHRTESSLASGQGGIAPAQRDYVVYPSPERTLAPLPPEWQGDAASSGSVLRPPPAPPRGPPFGSEVPRQTWVQPAAMPDACNNLTSEESVARTHDLTGFDPAQKVYPRAPHVSHVWPDALNADPSSQASHDTHVSPPNPVVAGSSLLAASTGGAMRTGKALRAPLSGDGKAMVDTKALSSAPACGVEELSMSEQTEVYMEAEAETKVALEGAGNASTDEERQLAAALEASRLAAEERQEEEDDARAAMEMAIKLSMMEAAPVHAYRQPGTCEGVGALPAQARSPAPPGTPDIPSVEIPADAHVGEATDGRMSFGVSTEKRHSNSSSSSSSSSSSNRSLGSTSQESVSSPTSAPQSSFQPYSALEPNEDPTLIAVSGSRALSYGFSDVSGPVSAHLEKKVMPVPPRAMSGSDESLPMGETQPGALAIAELVAAEREVIIPGTQNARKEDGVQDEGERDRGSQPRVNEENRYHDVMRKATSSASASSGYIHDDNRPTSREQGSGVKVEHEVGTFNLGAVDCSGAVVDQEEDDDELARVLQQSRVEAYRQVSLKGERRESVEDMMASVMEESRLEQERSDAMEQLEFERAMKASLQS